MLRSIDEAHEFIAQEVEKLTWEKVDENEKMILEELFEDSFFDKIGDVITEEEIENEKLKDANELEWFLFHKIPNYLTLLEETAKEVITEYLSE